jgi:hypothetical protein
MRIVPGRLDYLWFPGCGPDEQTPGHSVLSQARNRWGKKLFERFFVRTVYQCVKLGLVDRKKIPVDSGLADANAARASMLTASKEVVTALRKAYAAKEPEFEIKELMLRAHL